jgi:DNA-binding NarL/FixJ family response regulator
LTTNELIIRLVIASDNRIFREGLGRLLKEQTIFEIVAEAVDELQAAEVIRDLKPDIVLLCTALAELKGLQIIRAVNQNSPASKVIIVNGTMDEGAIINALKAGAKGYIPKDSGISILVSAIKAVHSGELWVERKLIAKYFDGDITADPGLAKSPEKIEEILTPREQDVLRILAQGATNQEIAQKLCISEKTVKSHLNSIFKKLNVKRRIEAILYAIKQGFC